MSSCSCLGLSGPLWTFLGLPGSSFAFLRLPEASWASLGLPGPSWALLGPPGPCVVEKERERERERERLRDSAGFTSGKQQPVTEAQVLHVSSPGACGEGRGARARHSNRGHGQVLNILAVALLPGLLLLLLLLLQAESATACRRIITNVQGKLFACLPARPGFLLVRLYARLLVLTILR